jgi:hypothetical protein
MEHVLISYGFKLLFKRLDECDMHANISGIRPNELHAILFANVDKRSERRFQKASRILCSKPATSFEYSPNLVYSWNRIADAHSRVSAFTIGNLPTMIARTLAHFCVESGYKSAAFFFDADEPGAGNFSNYIRIYGEIQALNPDFKFQIVVSARRSMGIARFRQRFVSPVFKPDAYLASAIAKYSLAGMKRVLENICFTKDMLHQFPSQKTSDVWIFGNDSDAARAIEWCKPRRIKIPQQKAVIGLENNPAYSEYGITSCVIDHSTIGYLMAHALIGDIPLEHTRTGLVRTRAIVIERQTT